MLQDPCQSSQLVDLLKNYGHNIYHALLQEKTCPEYAVQIQVDEFVADAILQVMIPI